MVLSLTEAGDVLVTKSGPVATITFGHPAHNSLPARLLRMLADAIHSAGEDLGIRCIVLQSMGEKTFCAGASFDELLAVNDTTSAQTFFSGFAGVINAIRTCGTIVVARIQGKAIGGGVGIAAAADYTFAAESASWRLSELAVGIGPFVIGPAVERKIGKAHFMTSTLRPESWFDAGWGKYTGLYQEVYADIATMDAALQSFCEILCTYNEVALSELKKVFWEHTDHWDTLLTERAAVSGKLLMTEYTQNKLAQLKRK
jgi:methylglutaconyl-CoA hydratase